MKFIYTTCISILLTLFAFESKGQETVFKLFAKDKKLADEYFEKHNYKDALELYLDEGQKKDASEGIYLNIARCYYYLKNLDSTIAVYGRYYEERDSLPLGDLYNLAEAHAGTKNYEQAIKVYKDYLKHRPDDDLVAKKIWRLNNISFLLEDSAHFAIRPLPLNTSSGELCAVPYRRGIIFMSNRDKIRLVDRIDASLNTPFYRLYFSDAIEDTLRVHEFQQYGKPTEFSKDFGSKFHIGPVSFYDDDTKMVFSTSGDESPSGERNLQLYFAREQEGVWKVTKSFPHNSINYSISEPTISEDGKLLVFSSDMDGGSGGRDLYMSEFVNSKWTKPVNLGPSINTPYDEVFPYLHAGSTLYFSSNGHAGMGGLDIFKTEINGGDFNEVENPGYPINTNFDDFGIVIDSLNTNGYLTSNRKSGGYDDDIYAFDMDIQTYPLEISGVIKYKEQNWVDSAKLLILPNATLYLLDNIKNVIVGETTSDKNGNFSFVVPYYSKYKISVKSGDIEEGIVSFEVPKHRKEVGKYEIVVVKDNFKSSKSTDL